MKSGMTVSEVAEKLAGTLPLDTSYFERQIRRWAQQGLFGDLPRRGPGRTASQLFEPMHVVMAFVFGRLTRIAGEGEILNIASRIMLQHRPAIPVNIFSADHSSVEVKTAGPLRTVRQPFAALAADFLAEPENDVLWFFVSIDTTDDRIVGGDTLGKGALSRQLQAGGFFIAPDGIAQYNPLTLTHVDTIISINFTGLEPSFFGMKSAGTK